MLYLAVSLALLLAPRFAYGTMTSTNYTITLDAIGMGGSESTSTSFYLSDSIGDTPVLLASSTSYTIYGGFQAAITGAISYSLSSSALNLGTLSTGAINSASTVATISCDTGFTLTTANVSGTMPAAVVGGAVTAGTEGYGLSVSGTHSSVVGDVPVVNGVILSSSTVQVINDPTTIVFKAAQSSGSTPGSYSQSVDLIATANY